MARSKYTRRPNGYFETTVWNGDYTPNGKKKYMMLRTKVSSKVLEQMVHEHNLKLNAGQITRDSTVTFYDYALAWKIAYKSDTTLNTQNMYKNAIETHLSSINCRLNDLSRAHYLTLLNSIEGNRTKQIVKMTFKQIVKSAIHDKLLPASALGDIFDDTPNVTYRSPKKRPLTEAEKKAVFNAQLSPQDKAFLYIIYGCGLRRGEACALTIFDINLNKKEISITGALEFDVNTPHEKDTKNYKHRVVPIPNSIYPEVAKYVKSLKGTYLFTTRDKKLITKSAMDKMWARILKAMQSVSSEPIVGLTPHIFRHNYCSVLCGKIPDISIPKIAELLGDSEKMVIDVYNHDVAGKQQPADVVSSALAL